MKTLIRAGIAALTVTLVASTAMAGPISSACMSAKRKAANSQLCGCIQQVADIALAGADQRRVATFFRNPDKAQETFMSKKRSDDAFWERYKAFGSLAEQSCSGTS